MTYQLMVKKTVERGKKNWIFVSSESFAPTNLIKTFENYLCQRKRKNLLMLKCPHYRLFKDKFIHFFIFLELCFLYSFCVCVCVSFLYLSWTLFSGVSSVFVLHICPNTYISFFNFALVFLLCFCYIFVLIPIFLSLTLPSFSSVFVFHFFRHFLGYFFL